MPQVLGLLLAAGAGRRMGMPKALVHDQDGTSWLRRTTAGLLESGTAEVIVVLGARANEAAPLIADLSGVTVVRADGWEQGMGVSLRTGLQALLDRPDHAAAALVTLVDLPDVGAPVGARILARWRAEGAGSRALSRATYRGRPGHPVLIGSAHWQALAVSAGGDRGAADYLRSHRVPGVECADLAGGDDRDIAEGPTR